MNITNYKKHYFEYLLYERIYILYFIDNVIFDINLYNYLRIICFIFTSLDVNCAAMCKCHLVTGNYCLSRIFVVAHSGKGCQQVTANFTPVLPILTWFNRLIPVVPHCPFSFACWETTSKYSRMLPIRDNGLALHTRPPLYLKMPTDKRANRYARISVRKPSSVIVGSLSLKYRLITADISRSIKFGRNILRGILNDFASLPT